MILNHLNLTVINPEETSAFLAKYFEHLAHVRQRPPQIVEGLALRTVRPEGAGDPGAGDGRPGAQREQREEPLPLAGA